MCKKGKIIAYSTNEDPDDKYAMINFFEPLKAGKQNEKGKKE
jgi:hypothetical protein